MTPMARRRQRSGSAHNNVGNGIPNARSGPATDKSKTCCVMCAESERFGGGVERRRQRDRDRQQAGVEAPRRDPTMGRPVAALQRSRPNAYAVAAVTTSNERAGLAITAPVSEHHVTHGE